MPRAVVLVLLILAVSPLSLGGQTDEATPPAGTPAGDATPKEQFDARVAEYGRLTEEFQKGFADLETDEQRRQHYEENSPDPTETANALLTLAEAHPDTIGFEVVEWILGNRVQGETKERTVAFIATHLVSDERIRPLLWNFSYEFDLTTERLLESIIAQEADANSRGIARYVLAKSLMSRIDFSSYLATANDEDLERMIDFFGRDTVDALRKVDADTLARRAEALLEQVEKEHAEITSRRGRPLGELAARDLFEMRNLSVGKTAPEIEGEDLFGTTFKLSDYRGKVIFLDFWGDW